MTVLVIAESTITCPSCGTSKKETMPIDACQFFYDCTGCGTLLSEARRLLRVLLLWKRPVPADSGSGRERCLLRMIAPHKAALRKVAACPENRRHFRERGRRPRRVRRR
jgi:hypothetical protein